MNIYQPFVGCSCHYQETFCFISTFKWCAADRSHKNRLTVCLVNKVGLFLVAFLFPLIPSISKANCAAMLPQWFKHSAGGRSFRPCVNERRFIPPTGGVSPDHWIKMQLLITFAQQQNFGAWRHVESPDRFRVIWDITFSFFSEQGEIVFACH